VQGANAGRQHLLAATTRSGETAFMAAAKAGHLVTMAVSDGCVRCGCHVCNCLLGAPDAWCSSQVLGAHDSATQWQVML
jgi:hypothetical protein